MNFMPLSKRHWLTATDFNDLYEDMARLNALYEELLWPHDDALTMQIVDDHIVIRNLAQEQRDCDITFTPDDDWVDRMND